MHNRRAFVAGTIALHAFPAIAGNAPSLPKIAAIRWPGPAHDLHGYMAVPANARGPQPAVLVVHDPINADDDALRLVDALARAGFAACTPKGIASLEEGVATVRWLATNAYATGKVAAIGVGWGGALVERIMLAPASLLSCAIVSGSNNPSDADGAVPVLHLPGEIGGKATIDPSWQQMIAFLRDHLLSAPLPRHRG